MITYEWRRKYWFEITVNPAADSACKALLLIVIANFESISSYISNFCAASLFILLFFCPLNLDFSGKQGQPDVGGDRNVITSAAIFRHRRLCKENLVDVLIFR